MYMCALAGRSCAGAGKKCAHLCNILLYLLETIARHPVALPPGPLHGSSTSLTPKSSRGIVQTSHVGRAPVFLLPFPSPPLPLPFPFSPLSSSSLSFPSPHPLLFPSSPLRSRPPYALLRLGSLGITFGIPQRAWAEHGRQTVFGEFQAKNVASSSNNLEELFRKWGTGTFMLDCRRSGTSIPVSKTRTFLCIFTVVIL